MKKAILLLILLLCVSLLLASCVGEVEPEMPTVPMSEPPTEPTPELPAEVHWEMHAYLVNTAGRVQDRFSMDINGSIVEINGKPFLQLNITPDPEKNFPYRFQIPEPNGDPCSALWPAGPGDYGTQGGCYYTPENKGASVVWAVNVEREIFIAWFGEEYGQLLVASTDPDVTPTDILAHFDPFLAAYAWLP